MKYRKVKNLDLLTLIMSLKRANNHPLIGNNDAKYTYSDLIARSFVLVPIPESVVESLIYCANLLNEEGEFVDILDRPFSKLINSIKDHDELFDEDNSIFYKDEK